MKTKDAVYLFSVAETIRLQLVVVLVKARDVLNKTLSLTDGADDIVDLVTGFQWVAGHSLPVIEHGPKKNKN